MGMSGSAMAPSLEEAYGLVRAAVMQRRPLSAVYDDAPRWFCPHVLGYNQPGQYRVFCYQYEGASISGPQPSTEAGIWRCISLEKLRSIELLDGQWRTEPHAPQRCVRHVEVDSDDYPAPQNGQ